MKVILCLIASITSLLFLSCSNNGSNAEIINTGNTKISGYVYLDTTQTALARKVGVANSLSPIVGTAVYLSKNGTSFLDSSLTDSTGYYEFTGMTEGTWIVSAKYPTVWQNLTVQVSNAAPEVHANIAFSENGNPFALSSSVSQSSSSVTIVYGTLLDSRDSKEYKTVVIGTQTWMAENLNYDTLDNVNSWSQNNGVPYGRLYDYATALVVCPATWHLPDTTEWNTLANFLGGDSIAGNLLKASSGWDTMTDSVFSDPDPYGFSALPGGFYSLTSGFFAVGSNGLWWTATPYSASFSWVRYMHYYLPGLDVDYMGNPANGNSVRCLKD